VLIGAWVSYNEGQPRKNSSKRLGMDPVAGWPGQSTARLGHPAGRALSAIQAANSHFPGKSSSKR
jgi:hypothetical protein